MQQASRPFLGAGHRFRDHLRLKEIIPPVGFSHYSLLTHGDEQAIDMEMKSMKKFSKNKNETTEITTRLKYVIKSLDGNEDRARIKSFVDKELLARDSLALREHIRENTPDLDMTFNFESEETGYTERMTIPLGVDFFYPSTGV